MPAFSARVRTSAMAPETMMPCPARIRGRLDLWINSRACAYSTPRRKIRTIPWQLRTGGFPIEFAGRLLRVLSYIDEHRTWPARSSHVKCLTQYTRQLIGVGDEVVVLGDRQGDAGNVGLLKRVEPISLLPTWPVMQTMGDESASRWRCR